jgi:preprotein translocase subunit SecA
MMGRFNIPEDEPIENRLITNALEKAQERIEGFNFDARKHVLEFDDVLNYQRNIVYGRRRKILLGEREELINYFNEILAILPEEKKGKFEEKRADLDTPEFLEVFRRVILGTLDMHWMDHLEAMDYLRNSVNLRAYGQRDPLVEYKKEGLRLFRSMIDAVKFDVANFITSEERMNA